MSDASQGGKNAGIIESLKYCNIPRLYSSGACRHRLRYGAPPCSIGPRRSLGEVGTQAPYNFRLKIDRKSDSSKQARRGGERVLAEPAPSFTSMPVTLMKSS